jgi:beta-lactamase class A
VASKHAYDALATKMARDIDGRLSGRVSAVGLYASDDLTGITCQYHAGWHFYAASVIKATIISALLLKAQEQHRQLTATERHLAWLMITESDNGAATALWNDVGFSHMQHFLNLAKMKETELNAAWGLTLITAHDEALLLTLISGPNTVLDQASRIYVRYLMAHVIPDQRWGVPAGAPRSVRVHVKNGWLPYPTSGQWEINSIGTFTTAHRGYLIAILTHGYQSMAYGITTIERAAEVIHRDLNSGTHDVIPPSKPNPTWGIPDETIPAASR